MAKKKENANGVNPKHAQAIERINFLHQAAMLMSTIQFDAPNNSKMKKPKVKNWQGDPKGTLHATSRYLNSNMKEISNKLVLRMDPSIKRGICQRCETPLIPILTNRIRIKSKPITKTVYTCKICNAKKQFISNNPNYELFNEKQDVLLFEQDQSIPK